MCLVKDFLFLLKLQGAQRAPRFRNLGAQPNFWVHRAPVHPLISSPVSMGLTLIQFLMLQIVYLMTVSIYQSPPPGISKSHYFVIFTIIEDCAIYPKQSATKTQQPSKLTKFTYRQYRQRCPFQGSSLSSGLLCRTAVTSWRVVSIRSTLVVICVVC